MPSTITFANRFGESIGPFLLWLRALGFFEWYVYMPIMTAVSIGIFWKLRDVLDRNGTFDGHRRPRRKLWLAAYYGLCFLSTNTLAVAFKTLIVEELDYPARVWFEAYVSPLHFYITLVAIAYIALIARNKRERSDLALGLFVQIALVLGYSVGVFRIFNEPISLLDPTTGVSGFVLCAWLAFLNYDLYLRFLSRESRLPRGPSILPRQGRHA